MDKPKHRKYTSIDQYKGNNHHNYDHLDCNWVVIEKIHGANFSIYVYENEIIGARRSDYVDEDEFFYDHKRIINELTSNLRLLHKVIGDYVIVGELFGGFYIHPDVPKSDTAVKTQNGIHYSLEINLLLLIYVKMVSITILIRPQNYSKFIIFHI